MPMPMPMPITEHMAHCALSMVTNAGSSTSVCTCADTCMPSTAALDEQDTNALIDVPRPAVTNPFTKGRSTKKTTSTPQLGKASDVHECLTSQSTPAVNNETKCKLLPQAKGTKKT